jgi:hypothetical protein
MTTAAMQATRPLTPEQYAERLRAYYEAIEPITRAMSAILAVQPVKLTMRADGTHVEREILWLQGSKEAYDRYVAMIEYTARRVMGGPV